MATLEKAIGRVLRNEDASVNDPRNADGATSFGISKRVFPNVDIH